MHPHSLGPGHQLLGVAAIPHHVELEPNRSIDSGRDLFESADRQCRLTEGDAGTLGGFRGLHFGPPGQHAAEANRRQDYRQRNLLTEHRRGERPRRDVAQDPLAKLNAAKVLAVRRHGHLGERPAVDVIKDLTGELAPGQLAVVVDRRQERG